MKKRVIFTFLLVAVSLAGIGLFYHSQKWGESKSPRRTIEAVRNDRPEVSQATNEAGGTFDTRRLTVLYTGNTQAYLEPCGCYVGQSGGIARRATLIENIKKTGIVPLVLDAGNVLDGQTFLERLRGETYLLAMKKIGYDAVNLCDEDFRFGLQFIETVSQQNAPTFISTNLSPPPSTKLRLKPYLIKEISGVRVAILGISTPSDPRMQWQAPLSAVKSATSELKDKADLVILLNNQPPSMNQQLLAESKGIDLVISSYEGETESVGGTLFVYSSEHGKFLQRLDLSLDAQKKIVGHETQSLLMDERVPDHPQIREQLTQFYDRVANAPELQKPTHLLFADQPHERDPRNGYVGAKSCETCHAREYNQWQTTEHAFAYHTLLEKQRYFYPDCVACHTTGFGYETGYQIGQAADTLAHVQCETCHGPGKKHIARPMRTNIRREVPVTLCAQCHNEEHSPSFMARAKEMIPLVDHSRRSKKAAELIAQRVGVQNRVKVELFVMSQCPYGTAAEKEIIPTIQEYHDRIDFQLYHIAREVGHAHEDGHHYDADKAPISRQSFKSLHGPEETEEGIRQVVIARYYPDQFLDYLLERTKNFPDASAWVDCANRAGIDAGRVRQIANSDEGRKLFHENIERSLTLGVDTSPTFIIDGHRYTNELFDKSSCYQRSDLVPVHTFLADFSIQSIVGESPSNTIPSEEYTSVLATLEKVRQKLVSEAANISQLQPVIGFYEEVSALRELQQKYPANLPIGILMAEVYREQGMQELAAQQYKDLGFILNNEWMVIGPFDNNRWASGFRKRYPPEKRLDFTATYDGQFGRNARWRRPIYETVSAYVDLKPVFKCDVCTSYAFATVEVPMEMEVQIRYAVLGITKLWVNEEQIGARKKGGSFQIDAEVATAKLKKGKNRILLKVVAQGSLNGFILRLTNLEGQPLSDLKLIELPLDL